MTTRSNPPSTPIPSFATLEEEAAFWDSHSLSDYWGAARPVEIQFGRGLSRGLTIRLDAETLTALRAAARIKGLGPTTLARSWILEHLALPAAANSRDS